jgi:hypothetical protein
MNYLFSTRIIQHKKRLRGWRERGERTGSIPIPESITAGITAASRASIAGTAASSASASVPSVAEPKRGSPAKLVIAVVAVVAVLAAGAVVVFMAPWKTAEKAPVPADPVLEFTEAETQPPPTEPEEEDTSLVEELSVPEEVRITFVVKPKFARIQVDGDRLIAGTRQVALPGDSKVHEIKITAGGYIPQIVEITADQDREVAVELVWAEKKGKPVGKPVAKKGTAPDKTPPPKKEEKKDVLKDSPY